MIKQLALGAMLALAAGTADAAVTFNLVNVTFVSGGTLTGSFTTNDALSAVTGYDLTASANGAFTGFRYLPANSAVTAQILPSQFFQIDTPGNVNELRVYFIPGLTQAGGTINGTFSYEAEPSGGNRQFSGTVTRAVAAVPDAASWMTMVGGFALIGAAMRRRNVAATFA